MSDSRVTPNASDASHESDAPGASVADSVARARALDPKTSFIVQAPAGSGKTELLTRRVLTLLATVNEPEEILAITFTRKAAAEMRARVVEALQEAHTQAVPANPFEREGYNLASAVLQRDAELQWGLLENPDRLRMSTIDSLCSMLAQQLPVTSTLGGVANPVDDASPLYREAARRRLKTGTANYRQLLATVGNKFDRAENLLAGMLSTRDQWLRYRVLFEHDDRAALREWLENQLKALVERELGVFERAARQSGVEHLLKTELLPLLNYATGALNQLGLINPEAKASRDLLATLTEAPALNADNLQAWQAMLECVFTAKGKSLRKRFVRTDGFPVTKKDAAIVGISESEARARSDGMKALVGALEDSSALVPVMQTVLNLPEPTYSDSQWALVEELLTELPGLERSLHAVFVDHSAIDFIEIALRAKRALGEEDAPTDLALAMDLRLRHVLVDEFQDTSRSQFELFQQLVAGWERGDGRTFFVVGDPMQSIYAFRAAEVSLFYHAKANGISTEVVLESLTLTVNFRSSPDVVTWVNDTFSAIFVPSEEADPAVGAIAYSHSVANRSNPGAVHVHPLLNQSEDEAGDVVADLVCDTLSSEDYQHDASRRIAILVRSRTAAAPIFRALQRRGVQSLSVDMDSLGEQPVVMDLLSLTLALQFPHNRLHWLSILRAPWCGLSLGDLHCLTHDPEGTHRYHSMLTLITDEMRIAQLSQEGRQRLSKFLDVIGPAHERASRSSLVTWVEAVWLQLGGPMLCQRAMDKNAAERCLKTLYELEARGELWQPRVMQKAMDRLYAVTPDDGSAKVHIMTMHKSKGLEFDTVILPSLNRSTRGNDTPLLDWSVVDADSAGASAMLLAPMAERGATAKEKSLGNLVKSVKSVGDDQETRRLLYVACTRAVRQLHLLAQVRVPADGLLKATNRSLLDPLWPCVQASFNAAAASVAVESVDDDELPANSSAAASAVPPPLLERVASDWSMPKLPSYTSPAAEDGVDPDDATLSVEYLWAGRTARAVGTVVHRHMERFHAQGLPSGDESGALLPVVMRQLRQQGLPETELMDSAKVVIDALTNVASDQRGQWLYDSSHRDAKAEWALTNVADNGTERRVIDRTFVAEDGTRWIIDFKTGDHRGGDLEGFLTREVERYGPQLRRYAEILSNFDDTPPRLALYFPLLQAFREVPLVDTAGA